MKEVNHFIQQFCDPEKLNLHLIKIKKDIYSVPTELKQHTSLSRLQALGTKIGSIDAKKFHPALPLLERIGQHTTKTIQVDAKAEWLFVCGRDVFASGITSTKPKERSLVIVQNSDAETLGMGVYSPKEDKVALKNVLDLGSYLRSE